MPGSFPARSGARERLRSRYRPAHLRLLFIGEAPPASGRFFYRRDSGLYRAFLTSFRETFPWVTEEDFLSFFRSCGCYLIDLCPFPVDRLDPRERRKACVASEPALCRTIRKLQPEAIATVVRSIKGNVEGAAARAGWSGRVLDLPYPGRWSSHREVFRSKLAPELELLRASWSAAEEGQGRDSYSR